LCSCGFHSSKKSSRSLGSNRAASRCNCQQL
jgi:hypothetical protein